MIGDSLKNIFDSVGFAYDSAFCQNNGSLKIFQNVFWKNPSTTLIDANFVGGDSYLKKIGKLPNFHFMFSDRYEIHIQAFLYFINGKLIMFQSSSS